ncbi:MAG: hypothetical protein QOH72_5665 [Solirubrobacteraceae bacterium]|jgi:hypothetical protein|nr:hypothetical protein [Solirubrobacteraceae bacterium]
MSFDTAIHQWREGERRLDEAPAPQKPALERVVGAIQRELRRRLGGSFTTDELADLYDSGTDWTLDLAASIAPGAPFAWDARIVADAAFARYLREATDFAGGRRIERY